MKQMATRLAEKQDDAQRLVGSFINSVVDSDGKLATNRTELINLIAQQTKTTRLPLSRREVEHVIDHLLAIVEDQLTRPDAEIRLGELGVLGVQRRVRHGEAEQLRNIHTGEAMKTPNISFHIRFQPSKGLKQK